MRWGGLAAVALIATAVYVAWPPEELQPSSARPADAHPPVGPTPVVAATPVADPKTEAGPVSVSPTLVAPVATDPREGSSLAGTSIDGAVRLDASGQLVTDRELRRYFDYWLGLLGEWPLERIRAAIEAALSDLPAAQRAAVMALFQRYIGLQQAAQALRASGSLEQRLQALIDLRRQWLGAEIADAFFAAEEQEQWRTLDRLAVDRDSTLSDGEKAAAAELIEQSRSLPDQQARAAYTEHLAALEQTRQFDAQGVDAAQRHAERSARYGAQAAAGLAAMDAENAEFSRRLREFRSARQGLLDDAQLSPADRDRAIAALLAASFDEAEQRRVAALDRIDKP